MEETKLAPIIIDPNSKMIIISCLNKDNLYDSLRIPFKYKNDLINTIKEKFPDKIKKEEIKKEKPKKLTKESIFIELCDMIKLGWDSDLIILENSTLRSNLGLNDISLGGFAYVISEKYNYDIDILEMFTINDIIEDVLKNHNNKKGEYIDVQFL